MAKDRSYSTAIHILAALSYQAPNLVRSEDLARGLQTNSGLIRRVLLKLAEHGLLTSTKGKGGGSQLAKPADQISMEDIYNAVNDSPLFGSFEKNPFRACPVSCNIGKVLNNFYGDLEDDLKKKMKKVKLSKIVSDLA